MYKYVYVLPSSTPQMMPMATLHLPNANAFAAYLNTVVPVPCAHLARALPNPFNT